MISVLDSIFICQDGFFICPDFIGDEKVIWEECEVRNA